MNKTVHLIQAPPTWIKTPSLSLAFLRAYLKKEKINLKTIDLNQLTFKTLTPDPKKWLSLDKTWENNLFAIVEKKYPFLLENIYKKVEASNFIGFTLFKRNLNFSFSLAENIKKIYPKKQIIFGGPHTLFLAKTQKTNQSDYWVIGEGEIPLTEIVKGGNKKKYYFSQVKDLDSLPFYDFTWLEKPNSLSCLPLFSSRGCQFHCNFCTECLLYKNFRFHSPKYLIDLISYLKAKHKINHFVFCDSFLNYSHNWLKTFSSLIIKKQINIKWEAQFRIDKNLDLALAKLLKKSGCYNLFVGLESGSSKILKLMNKQFAIQDALSFFKILNQARLHFEVSLILGYPGETKKNFAETVNFIQKNKKIIPKIAQINTFVDYLGSFKQRLISHKEKQERLDSLVKTIKNEKIPYTKSFIQNLIY